MKLLRFGEPGRERPGVLDASGAIRDLSAVVPDITPATLPDLPARLAGVNVDNLPVVEATSRIGACVGQPGKMVCVGLNFADHAAEAGLAVPSEPILFMKATTAICGPDDDLLIPPGSKKTDWEVELGVVIGQTARHVSEADAARHIAGYCVINDVSEREYQIERGGQWDKGKGYDSFGPIGPWLVTPDEAGDIDNLDMWLEVDGKRYQSGSTRTMIFRVPYLVSYISQFMTLAPGDIISTGTPPGVGLGQKPPVYLRAGQVVTLGISGLGTQRQTVRPSPFG